MGLQEYRRKRDFQKTPEPRGKAPRAHRQLAYLIQKHDASHLHYDFRLELDGVLKSWAVPKGPDLDPATKRLAMQVEDHPLEYGDFEGTIPEGEYGGGTVMLWDRGTWEPLGNPKQDLRDGHLKFVLQGEKLKGGWMLVRRGGRKAGADERHWFLFKERDEFAEPGSQVTETMPLSVTTGRDLDEIAEQSDRVWGAAGEVKQKGRPRKQTVRSSRKSGGVAGSGKSTVTGNAKQAAAHRNGTQLARRATGRRKTKSAPTVDRSAMKRLLDDSAVKRSKLPTSQAVELATLAKKSPSGSDWLHEIKFDGYRMVCRIDGGKVRFISRNGHEWTKKFPELAQAAGELPVEQALLDGEVVAVDSDGVTRFQALQNIFQSGLTRELVYYVFDILNLDGRDLKLVPLERRKEILRLVIAGSRHPSIRFSDHLEGSSAEIVDQACRMHLEGIVSKRRDSPYRPGRGVDWIKFKCSHREEFVIGGFTPPSGGRKHFGAILIGYYDAQRKLVYAGRVGTGFSDQSLAALHRRFAPLEQAKSPFVNLSGRTGQARGVHWLKPVLVAEVEFSNWTDEGLLRHPSFQGLREDKAAKEVHRDEPISPREIKTRPSAKAARPSRNSHQRGQKSAPPDSDGSNDPSPRDEILGVRLSHPEKILYPEAGITKWDLASYYAQVAAWMVPHLAGRPLAIVRCPAGREKPCFFQKHPAEGASQHLQRVDISEQGSAEYQMAVGDAAGLIELAQMGVLEIHVWGSTMKHLERPDRLVFDLDPDPTVEWPEVVRAAREVRLVLEDLGLIAFLKTTGGKGLHLVVPIEPRTDWKAAKAFCHAVANLIVRAAPDRYIATMSKAARRGKIFIDYLRNGRGATSVAPYSTRARPGATVSMPIAWDELNSRLHSDHFTIATASKRLAALKNDPWAKLATTRQRITKEMQRRLIS